MKTEGQHAAMETDSSKPAGAADTMRAIVQDAYGPAEVWRLAQIATPEVAAAEVLVKVRAAGLDRGTWHLMTGLPYLARLAIGFRKPRQPVPGLDLAGTVVAIGPAVTRFAVGDEVFGIGRGSFAEYAAAREDKLAHKPASLSFEAAAVVPVSGLTAIHAVRDAGRLVSGQRVLIVGASGGVGSYAVQLAKGMGAEVTGVCSTAKVDLVRSLGADHVIDYNRADFADGSQTYDLILDIGGSAKLSRLRRALARKGTLVIVGGEGGGRLTGGIGRQLRAMLLSPFVGQRLTMLIPKEHHADMERLGELIDAGTVTPSIDRTYPLAEAPDAMRHLVAGEVRGKVAISIT
jgi:NADPH:quinone reductase-like Zn-dependent oxidoreductase